MDKRLSRARLALAIVSTILEETAIWAVWRWVLPDFGIRLPVAAVVAVMVVWPAIGVWTFILTTRTLKKAAHAGLPSMVGMRGKAVKALAPEGMVKIKGELWQAVTGGEAIDKGEDIVVTAEEGLKLYVCKSGENPIKH